MKKYLSVVVAILMVTVATSIAAPDTDALMQKENAAWQAFKDKKADDFKKVVSADMVAVYDDGTSNMQKELSDMQKWDMKSFAISDFKITSIGRNVVISSYVVKVEGTYNGKDASGTYNAGSVWHKRGGTGDWMAIFHTNIKQAGTSDAQKKE